MPALEKQRYILDFTLSSLGRRKGKNGTLVLVYMFVIFLLASTLFFTHAIRQEAAQVLQDAPELMVQRLVAGRHELIPVGYAASLKAIKGVQSVRPRLWGYYFDATNGANYTLVVNQEVHGKPGSITVGSGVARNLPAGEHGTIPFKTYDGSYIFLKVQDIMPSESELVSADLIVLCEEDFRRIFKFPEDQATDLVLRVRNAKELPTIAAKITQIFPDTRPILRDEILRTYDAVFDWRGGLIVMILAGAFFAFIILAWDKATGLSAEEKREIGILKAIGWETSDILLMKFWEGAVISLSAFILGVVLAYAHVFLSSALLFEPVLKGWSVIYPHFRLSPRLDFYTLATLFFLTVVPYTVATVVPSWRAATIDPDIVMRA